MKNRHTQRTNLFNNLKVAVPELEELLELVNREHNYEDYIYRYYHHSFKVYRLQTMTKNIVTALQKLLPDQKLDSEFLEIYKSGIDRKWDLSHNKEWGKNTRPIVEAFFHVKFMLEMAVKYGKKLDNEVSLLPSGWAAFLSLYRLR